MGQRCDICIDPMCDDKKDCHCETCSRKNGCHRELVPTIRITTLCTQSCSHCCFNCTPQCNIFMELAQAKRINQFMHSNGIRKANVMGGEFFCHPEWKSILDSLGEGLADVRVVSNSDWAGDPKVAAEVVEFFLQHPNMRLSLSYDRWHTNWHVDAAVDLLEAAEIVYNLPDDEETKYDTLVPVGRSSYESSCFYGTFSCYCQNPLKKYHFLIDEDGAIYKCGFGIWNYADVDEYVDGGFAERFKEFNQKFYSIYISNCLSCSRMCPTNRKVKNKRIAP